MSVDPDLLLRQFQAVAANRIIRSSNVRDEEQEEHEEDEEDELKKDLGGVSPPTSPNGELLSQKQHKQTNVRHRHSGRGIRGLN